MRFPPVLRRLSARSGHGVLDVRTVTAGCGEQRKSGCVNRGQAETGEQGQRGCREVAWAVQCLVGARPCPVGAQAAGDHAFRAVQRVTNRAVGNRFRLERAEQQQAREADDVVSFRKPGSGRDAVGVDRSPSLGPAFEDHSCLGDPVRDSADGLLQVTSLGSAELIEVENRVVKQDSHDAVPRPEADLVIAGCGNIGEGRDLRWNPWPVAALVEQVLRRGREARREGRRDQMAETPVVDVVERVRVLVGDVVTPGFDNMQDADLYQVRHGVGQRDPFVSARSEVSESRRVGGDGLDPVG